MLIASSQILVAFAFPKMAVKPIRNKAKATSHFAIASDVTIAIAVGKGKMEKSSATKLCTVKSDLRNASSFVKKTSGKNRWQELINTEMGCTTKI